MYTSESPLRLLELWLPLAQRLNAAFGWKASGAQLEQVIIAAAPALSSILTVADACSILYDTYQRQ